MRSITIAICLTLALLSANSQAADQDNYSFGPWYLSDAEKGWHFDGIVGFEREPTYAGSDEYGSEADLNLRAIYKSGSGHLYFASLGEFGAVFKLAPDWRFQTVLEFEEGRESEEDATLNGLDEVESTLEGQLTLARRFGNFTLAGVLQPDLLGRGKGLVTFIAAAYDKTMLDKRLHMHLGVDLSWGNSEYMQTEFGITPAESTRTGYPSYRPGSGFKGTTVELATEYWINSQWSLLGTVEAEFYGSKPKNSPLISQEGSDSTYEVFLGVRYRF